MFTAKSSGNNFNIFQSLRYMIFETRFKMIFDVKYNENDDYTWYSKTFELPIAKYCAA